MLFDTIILTCCTRFQGSRSISAVYHLLKGKQSIQTVQDAHLYQLEHYFGIYSSLQKREFDERIHKLKIGGYLQCDEAIALPTSFASRWMDEKKDHLPLSYFHGSRYARMAPIFLQRLLLLIQTLTNSRMGNLSFIPVVDKPVVTDWVKQTFYTYRKEQENYLSKLYEELYRILGHFTELEASLFTDCLTGYQHYGLSSFQISEQYGVDELDVPLYKTAIIHRMLIIIEREEQAYPVLGSIKKELPAVSELSNSAKKTKALLDNQYRAEEIAARRRLKLNTIYDHLVEIALHDEEFPLTDYVTSVEQTEIEKAAQKTSSYKLKDIKQEVDESISYFQIRLVLARERLSSK
ncbi:hypothetical protein EU245_05910 [Lentibacillus lipolyticus]|nr:hypothetical protein EU245_05910 [Lentibacillus lipolyticus]